MTEQQAIALGESRFWETMTPRERATFQLYEDKLCMPFEIFHEAIETTLGRPVWTQEFGSSGIAQLRAELRGDRPAPTFEEIVNLIPADKRMIVVV